MVWSGESKDSGLGDSQTDVIVFDAASLFSLADESDGSSSETEADTQSMTSWEDISVLCPDMLLYRAAEVTVVHDVVYLTWVTRIVFS